MLSAERLPFRHVDGSGLFVGEITDPVPVAWDEVGTALRLVEAPADWVPAEHEMVLTGSRLTPRPARNG